MGVCYNCPYFMRAREGRILCEFARIAPPDKQALNEFLREHCASVDGYKKCTFYKLMEEHYERKFRAEFEAMALKGADNERN